MLTQRLTELEERGLVRRRKLPPPASVQVYEATEWGLEAARSFSTLGRWAARSPLHDPACRQRGFDHDVDADDVRSPSGRRA